MVKNNIRLTIIVLALSAILSALGCTILPHRQSETYPTVNHLPESTILSMAEEAFQQMDYNTYYDHGGLIGRKELDHWRIAIFVVVGTDSQGNRFLQGSSGVDTKDLEGVPGVGATATKELQRFHEVFGALAVQSGLPSGEVQKTTHVVTSPEELEPKGFE